MSWRRWRKLVDRQKTKDLVVNGRESFLLFLAVSDEIVANGYFCCR